MATLPLKPSRGGFSKPFRCGEFIRDFLMGAGPFGSPRINPAIGAPQSEIFKQYKLALMREISLDRATRFEEKAAQRKGRAISPDEIEEIANKYLVRIPYKTIACRFHSFVVYCSDLQKLGWIEPTGVVEPSKFQSHYPPGPPRKYFRLTKAGREASEDAWGNPHRTLYGRG
jgi:hypothetical protein